jgi:hypothetical protein
MRVILRADVHDTLDTPRAVHWEARIGLVLIRGLLHKIIDGAYSRRLSELNSYMRSGAVGNCRLSRQRRPWVSTFSTLRATL